MFQECCKFLASKSMKVECIKHNEILDYANKVDWIVFIDEDECKAMDTLYAKVLHNHFAREKCITWKKYFEYLAYRNMEEYLKVMKSKGVHVLDLWFEDNEYYDWLDKEIQSNLAVHGWKKGMSISSDMYKDFFDDLYSEEYAQQILHLDFAIETKSGCGKLKDCVGKYYNVICGERCTIGQPEEYQKTIYFVGPCLIYGHYVEDKNTIESFLQKRINDMQYNIRVVNCGSVGYHRNWGLVLASIKSMSLKKGDIIITYIDDVRLTKIEQLNLIDILEKYSIGAKYFVDAPAHCNHKVNALYAEAIYDKLQPVLSETVEGEGELIENNTDFMKEIYIDRYFKDFDSSKYKKIGAIVMNCNPFTNGHRYLIEQASQKVDFLIIFVVEEDKSVFTFAERFAMVCEGVADLDNVMAVPSGPFILAQTTFPEYFIKAADEDLAQNAENDITLFVERIAPYLNIKYRFVGEEPEDGVTNEYNLAMKKILPQHGIELIEIPRKEQDGKYISASSVRACLEKNDIEGFKKLVPESTVRVLFENGGQSIEHQLRVAGNRGIQTS